MSDRREEYVKKYYLNNYADGSVDDELKSVGLFVAENAHGKVLDCGCGPVPQLYVIFMPKMSELFAIDLPRESAEFVKDRIASAREWYRDFLPYQTMIEERYGAQSKDYILDQVSKIRDVRQADMSIELPFPDDYFDTVILFYSLGCLQNEQELEHALINIKRVLKPNGVLLYVNTNGKNSNQELPAYTWRGLDQASIFMKARILVAGFKIVSEEEVDVSRPGEHMYTYSQISLLKASKK